MHEKLHSHGNRLKRRRRKRWFCLFRPNFTEKKHCFFGQNFTENTVFLQAKFHRKNKLKRCLCFSRTTGCILPAPNITRPTIPVEILDIRVSRFKGKPNWSCKWAWKWKKMWKYLSLPASFTCSIHTSTKWSTFLLQIWIYLWWSKYLVFTCMPGERHRRWLRSLLLYLCYVFWALINFLVCCF